MAHLGGERAMMTHRSLEQLRRGGVTLRLLGVDAQDDVALRQASRLGGDQLWVEAHNARPLVASETDAQLR
eukprot:scaffold48194_cov69-Phaeocystis_antarctica.AAC.4